MGSIRSATHPSSRPVVGAGRATPRPRWPGRFASGPARVATRLLAALTALLVTAVPALAQLAEPTPAEAERLLSSERWREGAYGLSLRPPAGATHLPQTTDGALAMFVLEQDVSIRLFFLHHETATLDVELVKRQAKGKFALAFPSASLLEERKLVIAERPASLVSYEVANDRTAPLVCVQVFLQIEPATVAMFEFSSPVAALDRTRPMFDAMLSSIELTDPQVLNRQRTAWVTEGQHWRRQISIDQLKARLVPERWLRVLENGEDVGYIRVRERVTEMLGESGIEVQIQSRIVTPRGVFDSLSEFFMSDNRQTEVWSIRTTRRTDQPQVGLPSDQAQVGEGESWAATGVLSDGRLVVKREEPGDLEEANWQLPPEGYLTQVEAHLLPRLLPRDDKTVMGFYAYHPNTNRLALRTWRIEPAPGGGYRVHERPAPDRVELVTLYNADGDPVQRQMADGRVLIPSTAEEVREAWRYR